MSSSSPGHLSWAQRATCPRSFACWRGRRAAPRTTPHRPCRTTGPTVPNDNFKTLWSGSFFFGGELPDQRELFGARPNQLPFCEFRKRAGLSDKLVVASRLRDLVFHQSDNLVGL